MPGLTAWQGLFEHGRLHAGKSVLVHGAAGVVGSMASQLAREAGAYVIGTGRAGGRQTALDFGAQEFVDLDNEALEDVGAVDLVFDVIGGDIGKRSAGLIRAGGTLVTVTGPTEARPSGGLTIDFVVVPDRAQLSAVVQRVRNGQLCVVDGIVEVIDDARQLVLENGSVLKEFAYGSAHTLGIGKPLILVECLEADRLHKGAVQHGGVYSSERYPSVGLGVVDCFVDALGMRPIPPEPTPRHGPAGERFPVDHHAEAKDDIGGQDEYEGKVGPRHGAALAHS